MNNEGALPEATNLLGTIKNSINTQAFKEKFTKQKIAEIALYLGIGFLCGFLIKRYAHLIVLMILAMIGIVILHQVGLILFVINWAKVQEIFGIVQTSGQSSDWLAAYWAWITVNWVIVTSFTIGLLIGLKMG